MYRPRNYARVTLSFRGPGRKLNVFQKNRLPLFRVYMPFITSYFMLREPGDRPLVVPNGSKNLAFIGNFADTERDTVFTTEYSVRTAMEAVYQLLEVERGVPEVFASAYDLRVLANSVYYLSDKKKLTEMDMPFVERKMVEHFVKKFEDTYIGDILEKII